MTQKRSGNLSQCSTVQARESAENDLLLSGGLIETTTFIQVKGSWRTGGDIYGFNNIPIFHEIQIHTFCIKIPHHERI